MFGVRGENMAEDMSKMIKMCNCPACPSYVKCNGGELAFCLVNVGKSKCIKEEKGCLCMACPLAAKMKFSKVYYCTKGSDKQLSKKK